MHERRAGQATKFQKNRKRWVDCHTTKIYATEREIEGEQKILTFHLNGTQMFSFCDLRIIDRLVAHVDAKLQALGVIDATELKTAAYILYKPPLFNDMTKTTTTTATMTTATTTKEK
jgi:hypothetical protein